jgi:predicted amidohydrolase
MSPDAPAENPLTVACIQMEPRIGAKQANVEHSIALIDLTSSSARLLASLAMASRYIPHIAL